MSDWDDAILVGVVARTHGNRGEVVVNAETDFPEERFHEGAQLMARREGRQPRRRWKSRRCGCIRGGR